MAPLADTFAEEFPVPQKRPAIESQTNNKAPNSPSNSVLNAGDKVCFDQLKLSGASFTRIDSITDENGCGISAPVSLTSPVPGISLTPASQLSCPAALATINWVKTEILPAAKLLYPNDKLLSIRHGSTYVCRNRNQQADTKLSEHAKGNAIDITGFEFTSGKTLTIEPRQKTGQIEEAFQKAIRFGACLHFTTVLGPYSDAYHSDHLHLDTAKRKSGYRLCRFPEINTVQDTVQSAEPKASTND
ncbi:MAG: extensin family protein [Salaquimonas sp.]